jgi:hypothetical protein
MAVKPMQSLTLGPIIYHWKPEERRDFYARIADEAPVGTVYLGEVICSKRTPYFEGDYPEIIERLERGGKKVVLSSLSEVVLKREREMLAAICETEGHEIEINNTAGLLDVAERPHRVGPLMNIYNDETMRYLAGKGARISRFRSSCPPGWWLKWPGPPKAWVSGSKCRCLDAPRSPFRRAAIMPARIAVPRTIASSSARKTPTGCP